MACDNDSISTQAKSVKQTDYPQPPRTITSSRDVAIICPHRLAGQIIIQYTVKQYATQRDYQVVVFGLFTPESRPKSEPSRSMNKLNLIYFNNLDKGNGGDEGIRTLDGLMTHTPLAGERLRPLGHVSERGISASMALLQDRNDVFAKRNQFRLN